MGSSVQSKEKRKKTFQNTRKIIWSFFYQLCNYLSTLLDFEKYKSFNPKKK